MHGRFVPRYNQSTDEAEFLRGGEADVGDNRIPESSQEAAELGENHPKQRYSSNQNYPNSPSAYPPPSRPDNAVHPHPNNPARYGNMASMGVQHSIPLN